MNEHVEEAVKSLHRALRIAGGEYEIALRESEEAESKVIAIQAALDELQSQF